MLPWGHAAVAYLAYSLWCRRTDVAPPGAAVVALAIGSQFPDLVDKPLAWTLMVLPAGRSLGHSLFLTAALVAVGVAYARRVPRHRAPAYAFLLGYVSHLVTDAVDTLVGGGEVADLGSLLWPVVAVESTEHGLSFVEFFLALRLTPWVAFELALTLLAVGVWIYDGAPGLRTLAGWLRPGRLVTRG